jgi:hypothetical protein
MRIADKGADIVRITVQGKREADACFEIKNSLIQKKWACLTYFYLICKFMRVKNYLFVTSRKFPLQL